MKTLFNSLHTEIFSNTPVVYKKLKTLFFEDKLFFVFHPEHIRTPQLRIYVTLLSKTLEDN